MMVFTKFGKVETYLNREIKEKGSILLTLFDPPKFYGSKVTPEVFAKVAYEASEAGVSASMLGGSIGVTEEMINEYAKAIKKLVQDKPIIGFPSGSQTVAREEDAIWYMSLRNSREKFWIVTAPMLAAPIIKRYGIEPIPLAYLIVEPGGVAGYVGEADLIPRTKKGYKIAANYALSSQYSGFRWVYLEGGSGSPEPVPNEMISHVKEKIDVHLGTGGGIRNSKQAMEKAASGADYIFMGTKIEEITEKFSKGRISKRNTRRFFEEIVDSLKEGAKKRGLS
jgi:phosphoglycerol geranylgeranyltransferase